MIRVWYDMYDMYDYAAVSAILSALYTFPFPDEPIKPADSVFFFSPGHVQWYLLCLAWMDWNMLVFHMGTGQVHHQEKS